METGFQSDMVPSRWRWAGALLGTVVVAIAPQITAGQVFVSGSTGVDGAFNPTCTPTPCTVTVELPPSGVFNYTTVNVPVGLTVKYSRNQANTPVTILATGDVTIAGTIDVSGGNASSFTPGRGGPGGFDGGLGGTPAHIRGTAGLGPGGGPGGDPALGGSGRLGWASHGGYATAGSGPSGARDGQGGQAYGVHTLFPLIGGSGGGGGAGGTLSDGPGGGGGGGAILIASSGTIDLSNTVGFPSAIAGGGGQSTSLLVDPSNSTASGCGSGGGVRLIANVFSTNRFIDARGTCNTGFAGDGRIRLEFYQGPNVNSVNALPAASVGTPGQIPVVPGPDFPTVRITAIGGALVPPSPQTAFLAVPDTTLDPSTPNPIPVNLEATNVPLGTVIAVNVLTEGFPTPVTVNSTPLAGTFASSTATASVTLPPGVSVVTATATFAAAP